MSEVFRQIAELPPPRNPVSRMPKNPIDKSTIVSVFPQEINERKYTIEPGIFKIPAGRLDNPAILIVGSSSWWSYSGENRPTLEIPVSSVAIADSLIRDLQFDFSSVDAGPGLFFVPGELNLIDVKVRYKEALEDANNKQRIWFMNLTKIADSLWARANGNPLCISDQMRLAARELNLNDKPWLKDYQTVELEKCFACGSLKNPLYPVCQTCRAIDPRSEIAKEIKFAG